MINYSEHSLTEYLEKLSRREPVPGGGSAAAVAGALGAALIAMSARYSIGKGKASGVEAKINDIIAEADAARSQFIDLAGADAQAYQDVVAARKSGDTAAQGTANARASEVVAEIIRLCRTSLALTPYLHAEGNRNLISDVKAAEALLEAACRAAGFMQEPS
jgi:formiminotetrahydrofolate cyclodeaminase